VTGEEDVTNCQKLTSRKSVCTQFHCNRKPVSNRREKKCFIALPWRALRLCVNFFAYRPDPVRYNLIG
jgi:hypothetical protein